MGRPLNENDSMRDQYWRELVQFRTKRWFAVPQLYEFDRETRSMYFRIAAPERFHVISWKTRYAEGETDFQMAFPHRLLTLLAAVFRDRPDLDFNGEAIFHRGYIWGRTWDTPDGALPQVDDRDFLTYVASLGVPSLEAVQAEATKKLEENREALLRRRYGRDFNRFRIP